MQRWGWFLSIAGLLGMVFFWLTDPRYGLVARWDPPINPIDAANEAMLGTVVGVICSALILLIGLWLVVRRTYNKGG